MTNEGPTQQLPLVRQDSDNSPMTFTQVKNKQNIFYSDSNSIAKEEITLLSRLDHENVLNFTTWCAQQERDSHNWLPSLQARPRSVGDLLASTHTGGIGESHIFGILNGVLRALDYLQSSMFVLLDSSEKPEHNFSIQNVRNLKNSYIKLDNKLDKLQIFIANSLNI